MQNLCKDDFRVVTTAKNGVQFRSRVPVTVDLYVLKFFVLIALAYFRMNPEKIGGTLKDMWFRRAGMQRWSSKRNNCSWT